MVVCKNALFPPLSGTKAAKGLLVAEAGIRTEGAQTVLGFWWSSESELGFGKETVCCSACCDQRMGLYVSHCFYLLNLECSKQNLLNED